MPLHTLNAHALQLICATLGPEDRLRLVRACSRVFSSLLLANLVAHNRARAMVMNSFNTRGFYDGALRLTRDRAIFTMLLDDVATHVRTMMGHSDLEWRETPAGVIRYQHDVRLLQEYRWEYPFPTPQVMAERRANATVYATIALVRKEPTHLETVLQVRLGARLCPIHPCALIDIEDSTITIPDHAQASFAGDQDPVMVLRAMQWLSVENCALWK